MVSNLAVRLFHSLGFSRVQRCRGKHLLFFAGKAKQKHWEPQIHARFASNMHPISLAMAAISVLRFLKLTVVEKKDENGKLALFSKERWRYIKPGWAEPHL